MLYDNLLTLTFAGCVTCKARRVKCDETKPTCEQCARRRITCGGYRIDVRWKQASPPKKQSTPRKVNGNSSSQAPQPSENSHVPSSGRRVHESQSEQQSLPNSSGPDEAMDLIFPSDVNENHLNLPTPRTLDFLFSSYSEDMPPVPSMTEQVSQTSSTSPQDLSSTDPTHLTDYTSELWNMETFWEDYLKPCQATPVEPGLQCNGSQILPESSKDKENEAERIAFLFHQQTCHTLSIDEEQNTNPWTTFVWPMAKIYPALYHAIAALTCFCISKQQPQLRSDGSRHVQKSTRMLSDNIQSGGMPLDAALATTLALAFAETWEYDSSTSSNHIKTGGMLLQKLLLSRENAIPNIEEDACLIFLANTWTYMDVLARFTCPSLSQSYPESPADYDLSRFSQDACKLDPLMGYATTFFPIMRRVANLINKVRGRQTPRNSPAIISQALALRQTIEQWSPPIALESTDDPSQNMTDAIQTAEAYRWSTLFILYQAVPELPNLTSYGEQAQKILVYLATIPLNSTTIIAHIFPLMVAGCDAVEEEDRQFVRERWHAMSQRMVSGVVDRCLKITQEIWKRREEYLLERGLSFTSNGRWIDSPSNSNSSEQASLSNDIANFISAETSPGAGTGAGGKGGRVRRKGVNDFPISAAFKKGVDILTRSGCDEYTVRGRLHWLGVMRDWNWEGKSF